MPWTRRPARRRPKAAFRLPWLALECVERRVFGAAAVEVVERIAARHHPVSWRRRTIAERATQGLAPERPAGEDIRGKLGIRERHPPEPDGLEPAVAHTRLRDVRNPFLEIAPAGRHEYRLRNRFGERTRRPEEPCDSAQRILRRRIAVRWRKQRGSLYVRGVVRTGGGDVDPRHAELQQHPDESDRFAEVDAGRLVGVDSEAAAIGQRAGLRHARRGRRVAPVRHAVEDREPHPDPQPRCGGAHRADQRAGESRAVGQRRSAPASGSCACGEELVQQVAVAVLHVDEVESGGLRQLRRAHKRCDQGIDLFVGQQHGVILDTDAAIQQRMALRDARFPVARLRYGPASAVRELEADDRRRRSSALGFLEQRPPQTREVRRGVLIEHQLLRVRAPFANHGDGLSTPDPTGARCSEASPTAFRERCRKAVTRAVPALHRLHDEAIRCDQGAMRSGSEREGLGERRVGPDVDRVVTGKRDSELGKSVA
jgi:hypothetical protein